MRMMGTVGTVGTMGMMGMMSMQAADVTSLFRSKASHLAERPLSPAPDNY